QCDWSFVNGHNLDPNDLSRTRFPTIRICYIFKKTNSSVIFFWFVTFIIKHFRFFYRIQLNALTIDFLITILGIFLAYFLRISKHSYFPIR
ncbi:hypothetical protein QQ73_03220, partial [Candidatus Endoriftia persephone str. Guaymas]|nr:hypothetical protein [Candidatus Endoriftia persephone str. Guaymas]